MVDIRENAEAIGIINSILNNGGIAEVKIEKKAVAVVEIRRTLKTNRVHQSDKEQIDNK